MQTRHAWWLPALMVLGLFAGSGCSSSSAPNTAVSNYLVKAPTITVSAGQERYVCYTVTLDADLAVDGIEYVPQNYVHHVILSQSLATEQAGLAECDVIFRNTWLPMFVGGQGSAGLQYPAGDANVLPKGSQLVLQLHLLNATAADHTVNVEVGLHQSPLAHPVPVGLYVFGTQEISLPPLATSSVANECTPGQDVNAFAVLTHMHQLGTKLTMEMADETGTYATVYERNPYSFATQSIDKLPVAIPKGAKTRVTCTYDNTTNATVGYGESSYNEMCYLAMYVPGLSGAHGCIGHAPGDAGAGDGGAGDGGACMPPTNSLGIGAPCTAGGGQCGTGLSCTADQHASADGKGFCMKIGCNGASDCGAGATCCAPAQAGGAINICLPSECVPSDCAVK